jgi:hypothetical protein
MNGRTRLLLGAAAVALLVAGAGCTALFGSGNISDEQLDREPAEPYAWNETETDVTIWVEGGTYRAIYDLDDTERLELFRREFRNKAAVDVRAVRFRYPNGTVVNGSQLTVDKRDSKTVIEVPDPNGSLAYTAGATPKRFSVPNYMAGSYEVILPEHRRSNVPLFGDVSPGNYERRVEDDNRQHVVWDREVNGGISVRYYLQRDIRLFAALALVATAIGGAGALYKRREIKGLQQLRREYGLDVDDDDEFDDGPPPGMG